MPGPWLVPLGPRATPLGRLLAPAYPHPDFQFLGTNMAGYSNSHQTLLRGKQHSLKLARARSTAQEAAVTVQLRVVQARAGMQVCAAVLQLLQAVQVRTA